MSAFEHEFEGVLETHNLGRYTYRVIFMTPRLAARLPFERNPRLRFVGEIADHPVRAAWQPAPGGRRYAMVSPRLCREAGLHLGDRVAVRFSLDDPDAVDVPADLAQALAAHRTASKAWQGLTAGKQRALAYLVAGAKTAATRARRIATAIEWLETEAKSPGTLLRRKR